MTELANLQSSLDQLSVCPRRLLLEVPDIQATVPMLRGVWGAALHDLDFTAYQAVFSPNSGQAPGYVLRPAPPDPDFAPAVDWTLIGPSLRYERSLLRAWDVASGMGLGKERRRFFIREAKGLHPDGTVRDQATVWTLGQLHWPLPIDCPCQLCFPVPLRLMRRDRLIPRPTLTDVTVAACRRIKAYLPAGAQDAFSETSSQAISLSRTIPAAEWTGSRLDLHRYSGRQERELQIRGVAGWLELPEGPGPLWPLLAAAQWLHLGKSTVVGLGQLHIEF